MFTQLVRHVGIHSGQTIPIAKKGRDKTVFVFQNILSTVGQIVGLFNYCVGIGFRPWNIRKNIRTTPSAAAAAAASIRTVHFNA